MLGRRKCFRTQQAATKAIGPPAIKATQIAVARARDDRDLTGGNCQSAAVLLHRAAGQLEELDVGEIVEDHLISQLRRGQTLG